MKDSIHRLPLAVQCRKTKGSIVQWKLNKQRLKQVAYWEKIHPKATLRRVDFHIGTDIIH